MKAASEIEVDPALAAEARARGTEHLIISIQENRCNTQIVSKDQMARYGDQATPSLIAQYQRVEPPEQ